MFGAGETAQKSIAWDRMVIEAAMGAEGRRMTEGKLGGGPRWLDVAPHPIRRVTEPISASVGQPGGQCVAQPRFQRIREPFAAWCAPRNSECGTGCTLWALLAARGH